MTQIINNFHEISDRYEALFVDLWGCVHDGVKALPDAVTALQAYRRSGGKVILVTNSPRPRDQVVKQLRHFGVAEDAWDDIATSGDSARTAMYRGMVGSDIWHLGPPTDKHFFDPIDILDDPVEINQVALEDAEGIVCTGPFDPLADPAILRPQLLLAKQKGLKLLCANPDIVVDRGDIREWCAGAVAALYTEMGGESLYFGKPHPPIYDLARRKLSALGAEVANSDILAIGDGIHTDVKGAIGEDIDSLFITGGLAAQETHTRTQPDAEALAQFLDREMSSPTYSIGFLR
ncbi:MAG: TIGR01459 family HAD-type hydrolase [Roseobacter sp.]|nr:TIGR01459 family HAD-type hydrolase [Roseobacter sp.]MBV48675.1 TIGR01459 family HAD-type hydrolase [Roseobacter sp.]